MHSKVILAAFAAFWLTEAVRVAPGLDSWRDRKPLACSLCMSLWTSLAVLAALWLAGSPLGWLDSLAAAGGCYALLRLMEKPRVRLP